MNNPQVVDSSVDVITHIQQRPLVEMLDDPLDRGQHIEVLRITD